MFGLDENSPNTTFEGHRGKTSDQSSQGLQETSEINAFPLWGPPLGHLGEPSLCANTDQKFADSDTARYRKVDLWIFCKSYEI